MHRCSRLYVKQSPCCPSGIEDGQTWKTAFKTLQAALDQASLLAIPTSIWIAKGTYVPTKLYSPVNAQGVPVPGGASLNTSFGLRTFNLPDGVKLYGGFLGCESKLKERNFARHQTVLSGSSVSWHVITLGNDVLRTGVSVKIDGLTIRQGNAQGPSGGSVTNAAFNYAHNNGGGIYVTFNSKLTAVNTKIVNNTSTSIGGGIFSNNSNILSYRNFFTCNYSGSQGGAVAIYNTFEGGVSHLANIKKSKFVKNNTVNFGGAVVVVGSRTNSETETTIDGCLFHKNHALEGGALVVDSQAAKVTCSTFTNNLGSVNGGAIATTNLIASVQFGLGFPLINSRTSVKGCFFGKNSTLSSSELRSTILGGALGNSTTFPLGGGAISCFTNGILKVKTSKFFDNQANIGDGGAIVNGGGAASNPSGVNVVADSAITKISNCEFVRNRSINGGAVASYATAVVLTPPIIIPVTSTVLTVGCSTFDENLACDFGGAIYIARSVARLHDNQFSRNNARNGKKIYAENAIVNDTPVAVYVDSIC